MTGWDGFAKYVGIQGVLAVILTCAVVYLVVTTGAVPDVLMGAYGIIVGFYFGKNGRLIVSDIQAAKSAAGG